MWHNAQSRNAKFQIQNSRPAFAARLGRKTTNYDLVSQRKPLSFQLSVPRRDCGEKFV